MKAAEVLHVTPAALTSRIKLIEDDLGLLLFDRTGNRLRPTDAGREVVAAAARMERVVLDLADTLSAIKGLHGGRVSFGAISTAKYFAAQLIAAFLREHAGIDIRLAVGNRSETIEALRNYDIDIAVMGRPPRDFSVESEPFGPNPYVMIAAVDHPLARRRHVSQEDLSREKFLVREEGSGTRSVFEYYFNMPGAMHPKSTIEMGSDETIKQAVMAGLGLSLISAHTIATDVAAKRLAILKADGLPIMRQWFIVRRSDRELPPAARALWSFISGKGSAFLPDLGTKR